MARFSPVTLLAVLGLMLSCLTCKPRNVGSDLASGPSGRVRQVETAPSLYNVGSRKAAWQGERFLEQVQPVLAKRCVACHGCTDAPCSTKLSSLEMMMRGASQANPYAVRVGEATFPEERFGAPGFFPIINEKVADNMLFQFVKLGSGNTIETDPEQAFDLNAHTAQRQAYAQKPAFQCPRNSSDFAAYQAKYPKGGMPLGLARLSDDEHVALMTYAAGNSATNPVAVPELAKPSQFEVKTDGSAGAEIAANVPRVQFAAGCRYGHIFGHVPHGHAA